MILEIQIPRTIRHNLFSEASYFFVYNVILVCTMLSFLPETVVATEVCLRMPTRPFLRLEVWSLRLTMVMMERMKSVNLTG